MHNTLSQLPKILSFHKFATHEQWTHIDESDMRKNLSVAAIGKQDFLSDIDSRNCRVRDWSVDFSTAGINLENSRMSVDNHSQQSRSNEIVSQLNFREHSGENAAVDSSIFTKAWVDSEGSVGIKDYNAIDRWQSQAAAASSGFSHGTMHLTDEEDSNVNSKLYARKLSSVAIESSASHVALNNKSKGNQPRGAERLKHAVVDYVASLLMPLYKARKIDREGYKSIMKKTAAKVFSLIYAATLFFFFAAVSELTFFFSRSWNILMTWRKLWLYPSFLISDEKTRWGSQFICNYFEFCGFCFT